MNPILVKFYTCTSLLSFSCLSLSNCKAEANFCTILLDTAVFSHSWMLPSGAELVLYIAYTLVDNEDIVYSILLISISYAISIWVFSFTSVICRYFSSAHIVMGPCCANDFQVSCTRQVDSSTNIVWFRSRDAMQRWLNDVPALLEWRRMEKYLGANVQNFNLDEI